MAEQSVKVLSGECVRLGGEYGIVRRIEVTEEGGLWVENGGHLKKGDKELVIECVNSYGTFKMRVRRLNNTTAQVLSNSPLMVYCSDPREAEQSKTRKFAGATR